MEKRPKPQEYWTTKEVANLAMYRRAKFKMHEISEIMGRPFHSIGYALRFHNLVKKRGVYAKAEKTKLCV